MNEKDCAVSLIDRSGTSPEGLSPVQIRCLLEVYAVPDEVNRNNYNDCTYQALKEYQLIKSGRSVGEYYVTKRGKAYCEALQNIPLPNAIWVVRYYGEYVSNETT